MPSALSRDGSSNLALPKSAILIWSAPSASRVTSTLAGFKSLCRTSTAWTPDTAREISASIRTRLSSGIRGEAALAFSPIRPLRAAVLAPQKIGSASEVPLQRIWTR